ncbi:MAG: hypothetical protein Q8Q69_02350 [Nitrosopumilaceae archaeon]|nr:hypothetical protein [Nitrosopumilaceae archaeon]
MESFLNFLITFGLMIFAERIAQKIIRRKRSLKPFISMFVMAVCFAFIIADAVEPTFEHKTSDIEFYSMIAILVGYLVFTGLEQAKTVAKKMQFSYYFSMGCFTYVFIASGVMAYWLLPFSKFA